MDYRRRLSNLQAEMCKNDTDLVVYGTCQNYQYLTGIPIEWRCASDHLPRGFDVFVPREGEPVLTAPHPIESPCFKDVRVPDRNGTYADLVKSIVEGFKTPIRKVGLGRSLRGWTVVAVTSATPQATYVDGSGWLDRTRMIKEPEEIELLRQVAQLTDEVMKEVVDDLHEGVTQQDLILDIEARARRKGASQTSFGIFAGFMKSGAGAPMDITNVPFTQGLQANTAIAFDIGFVLNGYVSDWGRSVYWGNPPGFVVKAHQALRESVDEVVHAIGQGGMKASDVYPAIEKALDARGYGDQMRLRLAEHRGMGHSIGVEVHEHPWLGYLEHEPLVEGMVLAIEPKVWHPGEYYLRQEELVLITATGAEYLTNFDRERFVVG